MNIIFLIKPGASATWTLSGCRTRPPFHLYGETSKADWRNLKIQNFIVRIACKTLDYFLPKFNFQDSWTCPW